MRNRLHSMFRRKCKNKDAGKDEDEEEDKESVCGRRCAVCRIRFVFCAAVTVSCYVKGLKVGTRFGRLAGKNFG